MVILKRNYDVYISKAPEGTADSTNTVKLLVTDLSFNQASNLENIGRETLDPTQERIVAPHTSVVAPVSFSLTTYILPLVDTNVTSPEEYLWTSLMGNDSIAGSPNSTPSSSTIDFSEGNVGSLHELTLWFIDPNNSDASYRLDNAIVDSATINFDINNIASITWEGRALSLLRDSIPPTGAVDRTTASSCVKNKLSTITLDSYTLALTGGSISFNNNVEFYSRTQLGKTTTPSGHYTQNRTITGNLTFYMKHGSSLSADLFDTILSNADADAYETTYAADITINVGGTTAPYIAIDVPRAILEIPQLQFDEIISVDVPFVAKEGTGNYSSVIYYAT